MGKALREKGEATEYTKPNCAIPTRAILSDSHVFTDSFRAGSSSTQSTYLQFLAVRITYRTLTDIPVITFRDGKGEISGVDRGGLALRVIPTVKKY